MNEPKYTYEIALGKMMTKCSTSEKCSGDIFNKLREWGFCEEMAQKAVDKLIELRFIDDRRYAAAYVRDKSRFNGWGEIKISQMLRSKGVDSSIISSAMCENLDKTLVDEKCYKQLKKKSETTRYDSKYQLRAKLFAYGAGKGYKIDLINKHIDKLMSEIE